MTQFMEDRTEKALLSGGSQEARKRHLAVPFHQISVDEFKLLVDVASFEFRLLRIGKFALVSGCHPRFA
jgi:hypothetical protein